MIYHIKRLVTIGVNSIKDLDKWSWEVEEATKVAKVRGHLMKHMHSNNEE